MITTSLLPNGDVLVTFMIDDGRPVSVVGDFNGWDPSRDPFVEELDGRRYVTVSVPADTTQQGCQTQRRAGQQQRTPCRACLAGRAIHFCGLPALVSRTASV